MFKCSHRTLIFLAGLVWFLIGVFLLSLGIYFLLETLKNPYLSLRAGRFSILLFFSKFFAERSNALVMVLTVALFLGFLKGRYALSKSVTRQLNRVKTLPNPASLKYLYSKGYYLLIGSMMLLGIILKYLPITLDTRGFIDATIGAALINGSTLFFRALGPYSSFSKKERI